MTTMEDHMTIMDDHMTTMELITRSLNHTTYGCHMAIEKDKMAALEEGSYKNVITSSTSHPTPML